MKNRQLILGLLICLIGVSIVFVGAYISMNDKKENATIKHELAMVLIDENGNETDTTSFPSTTEYYMDFSKSFCENGSQLSWDKANSKVEVISNKADICKVYFRKNTQYSLKSAVLATNEVNKNTVDFSVAVADGEASLNRAIDDNGYSYYFRGDVENNYVQFGTYAKDQIIADNSLIYNFFDTIEDCEAAGKKNCEVFFEEGSPIYWRIVRINGDGSIRLIYDGHELIENSVKHHATLGSSVYCSTETGAFSVYKKNGIDSTIKSNVEGWYEDHLKTNYERYIADSVFCSDDSNGINYEKATEDRVVSNSPQLICSNDKYKYTVSNGYLNNPIGLITIDEALMAGFSDTPENVYLYSGERYWTMSPRRASYTYLLNESGVGSSTLDSPGSHNGGWYNARPVINIKADTMFTGLGTVDSPYKLVETATE